jgi:hypothetical protein
MQPLLSHLFFVVFLLLGISCSLPVTTAQQQPDGTTNNLNLADDPELLAAMEIFMGMSAQEREETIQGLMKTGAVGEDPAKQAEMEALIKMLPQLDDSSSLQRMIQDDEIHKAKESAKEQLKDDTWKSFWANQAEILESVLASGQLSPEDAARFKTDEAAWKEQLVIIWQDLNGGNGESSDEL